MGSPARKPGGGPAAQPLAGALSLFLYPTTVTYSEMVRSKVAFRFAVRTLFERSEKMYFWTFTFREALDVGTARALWEKFRKSLWKYGLHPDSGEQTIVGLRVFEMHPGGHGLHIHALFNRRINIHAVRRRATQFGMFWIHCIRVREDSHAVEMADYMGKYMSKEERPPCLKGARLWASIGKWGATRCKDIEIESEFVSQFRARRKLLTAEAEIAEMEGREYRMEHQLETMEWAHRFVFEVKIGKRVSLSGLVRDITENVVPTAPDWDDWDTAFDELGQRRGYWHHGEWVDETGEQSRTRSAWN